MIHKLQLVLWKSYQEKETSIISRRLKFLSIYFAFLLQSISLSSHMGAYHVIRFGEQIGISKNFERSYFYAISKNHLSSILVTLLKTKGANFLAIDTKSGLISWCEPGMGFNSIPVQLRKKGKTAFSPSLSYSYHVIYGTALLCETSHGTMLYLKALSQEPHKRSMVFSDGTYERNLFRLISKKTEDKFLKVKEKEIQTAKLFPRIKDVATTYEELLFNHFINMPDIKVEEFSSKSISKNYPMGIKEIWDACIKVISQYDIVIHVDSAEKQIFFLRSISVPDTKAKKKIDMNIIMLLLLQSQDADVTIVHLAYLALNKLEIKNTPNFEEINDDFFLSIFQKDPDKAAAILVEKQFYSELTTQVLYKERWENKFMK